MSYEIVLADQPAAETGVLTLYLDQQIEIQISAQEARRRVNNWAHLELSSQIHAAQPQLIIAAEGAAYWRVPLHLTFPALGDVGSVGFVLVDVRLGLIEPTSDFIEDIQQHAQALAQRFTPIPA
ncbi:MAG: hypothetical protein IAE79_24905 [Anaerolinea sp.]|nr:hypothetical protein [Anaerolinea sp.]